VTVPSVTLSPSWGMLTATDIVSVTPLSETRKPETFFVSSQARGWPGSQKPSF
jgi:hypothetical protein